MAVDQLTITDEQLLDKLGSAREELLREIRKAIIGQDEVIEQVLLALFVGGHSIITGVPGLAKTLLVRTIANVLDLSFKRIQFTPDLMPADITGTEIIEEDRATGRRAMQFIPVPVFANIVLAAKDAGCVARSDAGRPRHGAGRELRSAPSVSRARDAEPDRDGRHLSLARSAARSFHVQCEDWLLAGGRGSCRGQANHVAAGLRF